MRMRPPRAWGGGWQVVVFRELEKPREAGLTLELLKQDGYDEVVGRLAEALRLPEQNKDGNYIRLTARAPRRPRRPLGISGGGADARSR